MGFPSPTRQLPSGLTESEFWYASSRSAAQAKRHGLPSAALPSFRSTARHRTGTTPDATAAAKRDDGDGQTAGNGSGGQRMGAAQ